MKADEETVEMIRRVIGQMEAPDREACQALIGIVRQGITQAGEGNGRLVLALLSAEYRLKAERT